MTLQSPPTTVSRNSIDLVWNALDAGGYKPEKQRGDKFMALCPVHGDSHRSLSVKYDRGRRAVLFNCFTCSADVRDVAAALNLSVQDLFDEPLPDRKTGEGAAPRRKVAFQPHKVPARITAAPVDVDELKNATWEKVIAYPYYNARGTLVEEVIREQTVVNGVTHKRFIQRFLGPSGRMVSRKPAGFAPVLYHHPEILAAIAEGKTVWIVEGEKDADNAIALGLAATTNAQGAGSFPEDLVGVFAGATVNIVADRDVAGYKRATSLFPLLQAQGATVRILLPALEDDKADLSDHLDAGLGINDLQEVALEDAGVLVLLGEARKVLESIEVCKAEVIAHIDALSSAEEPAGDDHRGNARAWAKESAIRFGRISDSGIGTSLFVDSYGPTGKAAAAELQTVINDAAQVSAEAHEIAELPAPVSITERLAKAGGRVIDLGGQGSGGKPPRYLGDDFIPGDDGTPNVETKYLVRQGKTVQKKVERDGDTYRDRYHTILHGWAEIEAISFEDNGDPSTPMVTTEMTVKFSQWDRKPDGTPKLDEYDLPIVLEKTVTWRDDVLSNGSWAQSLPFVGMLENSSRRGKDAAWDAIHKARPTPSALTRVYTSTGWRKSDLGVDYFVHAGGAITADGQLPVKTRLNGGVQNLTLPEPTLDRDILRAAWISGTLPLREHIPGRVMAPLLGLAWEAPFAPVQLITYLHGAPGAGKSACARQAMQYFAPDLRQAAGSTKTILSATQGGGTGLGLSRTLSSANDLPVLVDDFVDDQDVRRAEAKLDSLARSVFDRSTRVVAKQRGGTSETPPINASVIATGQVGIHGSGLQRVFTIGMNPGEIANPSDTFAELETKALRNARATLGAALIQWLAKNRDSLKEQYFDEDAPGPSSHAVLSRQWMKRIQDLPHTEGAKGRMVTAAVAAIHGVHLMLRMLVDHDAITRDEANDFYAWANDGIYEALRRQDGGAGDPGLLTMDLLREALASNAAHLTQSDGGLPTQPDQLGWSSRGVAPHDTWYANGSRVGAIKPDGENPRLLLHPRETYKIITNVARGASESFSDTITSIGSSFIAHGWMKADGDGNQTIGRRVAGTLVRVWDIPLSVLLGDPDSDTPQQAGTDVPTPPAAPSLFDFQPSTDETPSQPAAPAAPADAPGEPEAPAEAQRPASPAASAPRPRRAPAGEFRAAAAVLHTDGLWLPDGELVTLAHPIEHLGDFAKLVAELKLGTLNGWKREDGQILVTHEAALSLGIAVDRLPAVGSFDFTTALKDITRDHPLITKAIDAGYSIGGKEAVLNATTRIWHADNQALRARLVLLPALKDDFKHILEGDPDSQTIARRLQRFADALHAPYAISASTTGIDLMLTLHWKDRERLFAPSAPVPPAEIATLEADIDWQRKPTAVELEHKYVHAYDRGGSYLAGISGLELGVGDPRYFPDGTAFDRRQPGYWKIAMPAKGEWLLPNPIDPRNREDDITGKLTWVSTPTLDVAASLGYEFDVVEAYVWEQHSRILDTWYERVRDARTALDTNDVDDQAARNLLKEVYVRSLGLTASFDHHKGRLGFAPERYHFIQARARANIIRRIQKIGAETDRWPVAVSRDTVLYTSNEVDPVLAWPGEAKDYGRGLGQYKYERSGELVDQLKYLTGEGRYLGKDHLDIDWIG